MIFWDRSTVVVLILVLFPIAAAEEEGDSTPFLSTPQDRFDVGTVLYEYPYEPKFITLDSNGLRMAYVDEGPSQDAPPPSGTFLCIHGSGPTYGYLYRKMIPDLVQNGDGRVIAPDLIGFGRSDKPTNPDVHTLEFHRNSILQLIDELDLTNLTVVVHGFAGSIGLTLPMASPGRIQRFIIMNTFMPIEPFASTFFRDGYQRASGEPPQTPFGSLLDQVRNQTREFDVGAIMRFGVGDILEDVQVEAYEAPFPEEAFKVGVRQFPLLIPLVEEMDGFEVLSAAMDYLNTTWDGETFMVMGGFDPVLGPPIMEPLCQLIRGCSNPMLIPQARHFVPEYGDIVATEALRFFRTKPSRRNNLPSEYHLRAKERKSIDFVRTPTPLFKVLRQSDEFPYKPKYSRKVVKGMRMAYIDEGPRNANRTYLCLHGQPTYSYLYRKMIAVFLEKDDSARVVAIDFFGFGRSDKPTNREDYTFAFHRDSLIRMIQKLGLRNVTLVSQDWGGVLGLTLPPDDPERYDRLIIMNTFLPVEPFSAVLAQDVLFRPEGQAPQTAFGQLRLLAFGDDLDVPAFINSGLEFSATPGQLAPYDLPFPDKSFKAGALQFPLLLNLAPQVPGYFTGRRALRFYNSTAWTGQIFMAIGPLDPALTVELMTDICTVMNGCEVNDILSIPEASHFVQEFDGDVVAEEALRYFDEQ